MDILKPNPRPVRIFFFWSGVIATLAYRIIIVLNYYSPVWVKISWYVGTIGFIIFFWHRYVIDKKRSKVVDDYKLLEAVERGLYDSTEQKKAMEYVVRTTQTSRSKWNSMFIFGMSVLALIVGLALDLYNLYG